MSSITKFIRWIIIIFCGFTFIGFSVSLVLGIVEKANGGPWIEGFFWYTILSPITGAITIYNIVCIVKDESILYEAIRNGDLLQNIGHGIAAAFVFIGHAIIYPFVALLELFKKIKSRKEKKVKYPHNYSYNRNNKHQRQHGNKSAFSTKKESKMNKTKDSKTKKTKIEKFIERSNKKIEKHEKAEIKRKKKLEKRLARINKRVKFKLAVKLLFYKTALGKLFEKRENEKREKWLEECKKSVKEHELKVEERRRELGLNPHPTEEELKQEKETLAHAEDVCHRLDFLLGNALYYYPTQSLFTIHDHYEKAGPIPNQIKAAVRCYSNDHRDNYKDSTNIERFLSKEGLVERIESANRSFREVIEECRKYKLEITIYFTFNYRAIKEWYTYEGRVIGFVPLGKSVDIRISYSLKFSYKDPTDCFSLVPGSYKQFIFSPKKTSYNNPYTEHH